MASVDLRPLRSARPSSPPAAHRESPWAFVVALAVGGTMLAAIAAVSWLVVSATASPTGPDLGQPGAVARADAAAVPDGPAPSTGTVDPGPPLVRLPKSSRAVLAARRPPAPLKGVELPAGKEAAGPAVRETPPENKGPVRLLTASWLGGAYADEIVAAEIAPDGTILLAGNTVDSSFPGVKPLLLGPAGKLDATAAPPKKGQPPRWTHPSTHGFVARLSPDGAKVVALTRFGYGQATVQKLKLDSEGRPYLLASATVADFPLPGGVKGKGPFVARLSADLDQIDAGTFHAGAMDFGVDGNGEYVVLTKAKMTRYPADGAKPKWTVTWKAFGDNRPGAMTVSPHTGVACVVGYGMTHTGKEPYKDPYGYGFDREGKQVWALWNPDPKKEKGTKFSTPGEVCNGLMADTTGHAASAAADGKVYFTLFADGGNTVCTRDPLDVDKPLDPNVFAGVHQNGPGFGFKGASKTSVVFRIDSAKGKLEKGTWMSAWLTKARANGLAMDAAASDAKGRQFVAGGSAAGCPTKDPWYVCKEGGYNGGGFLAVFDPDFRMLQCGYFPGASIKCVATRGGTVVIAGTARQYEDEPTRTPARVFHPAQKRYGGGERDGYFAVFKVEDK